MADPTPAQVQHHLSLFIADMERLFLAHRAAAGYPTTELAILTQSDGRTYQMNRNREVIWRDASKIRYYPAGNHPTYAVFAAHHCGQHIADQLTTWCWETPTHTPTSQEPLF